MASLNLKRLLNEAIAREIAVSIQYMWQHVMVKGIVTESVAPVFRTTALTEMRHAELIAERLDYIGGVPTTKPTKIEVDGSAENMLKKDVKAEEEAIALYRSIIKLADKEGDTTTKILMEKILSDEEEHHKIFTTLLGK
ncbi:MAG: ferritin-like domain-containing protein [Nitrospirae bacterium]|nr:ferritin-like domain-containing protein [Nitrospirota bacterium]